MANRTDPLMNAVSGNDPQNLLEYITRTKIYETRFWKEECFGLSVADVLEKAATRVRAIGTLPVTQALALLLKLLQLHPSHELVHTSFIQQTTFKYVRVIGVLYVRLTSRPIDIYESLEVLYNDYRKLRVWTSASNCWSIIAMDEFIHSMLSPSSGKNCFGISLPRLPLRQSLQEAGYLPDGPRVTKLQLQKVEQFDTHDDSSNDNDDDSKPNAIIQYLRYKAMMEKCPVAIVAWEKRFGTILPTNKKQQEKKRRRQDENKNIADEHVDNNNDCGTATKNDTNSTKDDDTETKSSKKKKKKKKSKKDNTFGSLFKKKETAATTTNTKKKSNNAVEEGSEEYWNEQRAKLGLSQLK